MGYRFVWAILGWLLTWATFLGYSFLFKTAVEKMLHKNSGFAVNMGSIVGFFAGVLLVGKFAPDSNGSWIENYGRALVFFLTSGPGIIITAGNLAGWWQLAANRTNKQ